MPRYKHGLVFNFHHHLKQHAGHPIFDSVDRYRLLTHVVKFLTEDVYDKRMGKEQLSEIEYLIGLLYDQEIIPDFLVGDNVTYSYVYRVVFSICESVASLMHDTGILDKIYQYHEEPVVIQNSPHNFTIVVKEIR